MTKRSKKIKSMNEVSYRFSSDWVDTLESEEHWRLCWRQQKFMQKKVLPGPRVLEIAVGRNVSLNTLSTASEPVNIEAMSGELTYEIIEYRAWIPLEHRIGKKLYDLFVEGLFHDHDTALSINKHLIWQWKLWRRLFKPSHLRCCL